VEIPQESLVEPSLGMGGLEKNNSESCTAGEAQHRTVNPSVFEGSIPIEVQMEKEQTVKASAPMPAVGTQPSIVGEKAQHHTVQAPTNVQKEREETMISPAVPVLTVEGEKETEQEAKTYTQHEESDASSVEEEGEEQVMQEQGLPLHSVHDNPEWQQK